ncbi:MAG: SDR family oxidoreductase [Chloroflexi bacterium]|jgi:short-subunit dehydrogenase|uniref:NADP-dependent 3-hydroxy acid dehydrogenase YdfG n=1 Tax=Candidatus Thermofonsia Clade 3 bacterium TaxID=2364212 RepID=A0A2M8QDM4_9CHLR|nr:SDR family oxidoreductase [Candidatus Roseilinea sp. NK_OTU-006]PJF47904.1 MAG: NAD(P)-dependent oxidoreductase [Candidatus Thermofonsia Clade 3 bacterium]RMG65533.1 MAG: SDR family oxidoreductase [Chloroflexota bacterium]
MSIVTRLFTWIGAAMGGAFAWKLLQPEFVQRSPSRFLAGAEGGRDGRPPIALVTGASAGIGAAFARQLARAGYDLVLVARRKERLTALADSLRQQHAIEAHVLDADLADSDDIERVADVAADVSEAGRLDLLINNAGFGTVGKYADLPFESQLDMLHVHLAAPMRLMRAALPGMLRRRRGGIINVASTAGWYPLAGNATYSATKRYLINFSESLQAELEGSGVCVQALCPGFTYSEFHDREPYRASGFRREQLPAFMWQTAEAVVAASLNALGREVVCIPGAHNRLIALVGNFAPMGLVNAVWRRASPV